MAKTITVTINEDGSSTVATKGFAGASCLSETARLEAALGATTANQPTPEMHQTAAQVQKAGQR
jgi:hypothetical protein